MITYSKNINQLQCYAEIDGTANVVFTVTWLLSGADGNFASSLPCATTVPYTAGQEFTPYSELTQEQIMSWIEEFTDPIMMASYEKSVADSIDRQKTVLTPNLPWEQL